MCLASALVKMYLGTSMLHSSSRSSGSGLSSEA